MAVKDLIPQFRSRSSAVRGESKNPILDARNSRASSAIEERAAAGSTERALHAVGASTC
jgi:hypothetical protein